MHTEQHKPQLQKNYAINEKHQIIHDYMTVPNLSLKWSQSWFILSSVHKILKYDALLKIKPVNSNTLGLWHSLGCSVYGGPLVTFQMSSSC